MTDTISSTDISTSCRVLGALFYLPPNAPATQPFLALLGQGSLPQAWPFGTKEELDDLQVHMAQDLDLQRLAKAYQNLFVGPDHLEAPPWGSVYLTEDGTLCGNSTLALRAFLHAERITFDIRANEPEDHIGLLFWALAWLAEQQRPATLGTLLDEHLLPWSGLYLNAFTAAADHPFYVGLGRLASLTLTSIQNALKAS
jgi:putative dimethyl sulfoxide reductase chaperone